MQACVAQYAGALPASFSTADAVPAAAFDTRAQKQAKARVPPGAEVVVAPQQSALKTAHPAASPAVGRVAKGPVSFALDTQPLTSAVVQPWCPLLHRPHRLLAG